MKTMKRNRMIFLVGLSLLLLTALPAVAFAQGRGRGQEKKLDRFVNGHDARDGRWDGRGPVIGSRTGYNDVIWQQRGGDRFRDREFDRNWRFRDRRFELRRRGFDRNDSWRWQRLHNRGYRYRRGLYR
jgi:hypothetical protein